jgi:hypothetical protein
MKIAVIIVSCLFIAKVAFAQKTADAIINDMPMVGGRLVYGGAVEVKNHKRKLLDSVGKQWLFNYFKDNKLSDANGKFTPALDDTSRLTLRGGLINFRIAPGMIKIDFYAFVNLKFKCVNEKYFYQIDSIYFRPKKAALNTLGFQNNPEYLLKLYKQKHFGLWDYMQIPKSSISRYLLGLDMAIQECIASLNNAMSN